MSTPNANNESTSSIRVDRPVPMHSKVKPQGNNRSAVVNTALAAELLKITASDLNESAAREGYRKLLMISAGGLGICHLTKSGSQWRLMNEGKTGRAPKVTDLESLQEICDQVYSGGKPQVTSMECLDSLNGILAPVAVPGQDAELLLLVVKRSSNTQVVLKSVQQVVIAMKLWLGRKSAAEANWQVASLASIIELVGKIETSATVNAAAEEIVNATLRRSGASVAAIAFRKKGDLKLTAVSGVQKLDRSSQISRDYLQVLTESSVREQQAIYPPLDANNDHLLNAHQQALVTLQEQAMLSQPLVTSDGDEVGAWCFAGMQNTIHHPGLSRFVAAASPHVADAIQILRRAEKSRLARVTTLIKKKTSVLTRLIVPLGILACVLAMWIPVTYRVRCNAVIEPATRRFAVAPFDWLVLMGFAEPGDLVKQGEVLAEIDGRTIRWELSGVTAERRQSLRQREIELTDRNIPKAFLAELENERLTAEESVLKFKRENLQVRSPVDGVVLSGSLERSEAASVETGQVLFEIGQMDPIKVQLAVPAEDIAQVSVGDPVTIWIDGQEEQPIEAEIARIQPRSEIRDARNVFVAEIEVDNELERFRPGMKGSVRIDGRKRTLGWTLFHKPINYMRSRFTFF